MRIDFADSDGEQVVFHAERVQELVRCKDCKYYELNHFETIEGIPLIVAHHICAKWGDGCKTDENGFCFMGEKVAK